MKKSDKLSFSKKGVILLILFAIYNSTFAFDFILSSDTGINFFSDYNSSFKSNNNKDSIPFAPPVNYTAGDRPVSIFCADLDMDGDLDMAVANNFGYDVSILKNNGDGTFEDPVNYPAGDDPFSIYCADLDGDNDIDIAVASYYVIAVLLNNGDGTFEGPDIYGEGANHFYFICCADLNGDSYPELVAADPHGFTAVFILINNGDGTFIYDYNNYWVGGYEPWSVSCSDLDGDDDLDMSVANHGSSDVSVFMNNGDGTFADAVSYATGADPRFVYTADLDNDLDIDIAVANSGSDDVSILMNNGDGTFGSAVNYGTGAYPASIFCSDLDGDNDIDLALANFSSNNISILTNNGDGTYDNAVNYPTGNGSESVFGGDLDADEDIDLTVANWSGDNVSVLFNLSQAPSNLPPDPFSLISPANGSNVTQQITFDWETANDPNAGDTVTYDLYISTSVGFFPDSTIIDSNLTVSEHTRTLIPDNYFWKVKAKDNWEAETWSVQTWNFGVITGIEENKLNSEISFLFKNYPNPFSRSTVIGYRLPVSGKVVLKVYDMHGHEVRTLVNENQSVGNHSVVWDGKNNSGNAVKPGVYFYQLKTGNNFSSTKKMLLLK